MLDEWGAGSPCAWPPSDEQRRAGEELRAPAILVWSTQSEPSSTQRDYRPYQRSIELTGPSPTPLAAARNHSEDRREKGRKSGACWAAGLCCEMRLQGRRPRAHGAKLPCTGMLEPSGNDQNRRPSFPERYQQKRGEPKIGRKSTQIETKRFQTLLR